MGLGTTYSSNEINGLIMYMEPGYMINKRYRVGMRFEGAFLYMKNILSVGTNFDYYFFNNHTVSLFAGGGPALYGKGESGGCSAGAPTQSSETKIFGGFVRSGLQLKRLRVSLEYNFVPSTYVNNFETEYQKSSTVIYSNSYLALKVGISLSREPKKHRKKKSQD